MTTSLPSAPIVGSPVTAQWGREVAGAIRDLQPRAGRAGNGVSFGRKAERAAAQMVPVGTSGLWGVRIVGAKITVFQGAGRRASTPILTSADPVTITITADGQFVAWQYDPNPAAPVLSVLPDPVTPDPEIGVPVDADGYMRGPLYEMGFDADRSLTWIRRPWEFGMVPLHLFGA